MSRKPVAGARLMMATAAFLVAGGVPVVSASAATPTPKGTNAASARPHTGFGTQGVDAYGDAPALGGFGSEQLSAPVVGISAMPGGGGYRVAASDGGVL
ncbi:MAG: hypothetical protein ACYCSJ_06230, partial [Acidimicrobiales bacterium]